MESMDLVINLRDAVGFLNETTQRLRIPENLDVTKLRWEISVACAAFAPNDDGDLLCPESVWRALICGVLDERMVEAQWGPLPERRKSHFHDEERRLAFDAAAVASASPGPWWVRMAPLTLSEQIRQ